MPSFILGATIWLQEAKGTLAVIRFGLLELLPLDQNLRSLQKYISSSRKIQSFQTWTHQVVVRKDCS